MHRYSAALSRVRYDMNIVQGATEISDGFRDTRDAKVTEHSVTCTSCTFFDVYKQVPAAANMNIR